MNVANASDVPFRATYTAFGEATITGTADFLPFGFAGGLFDIETGLVRFGARDYDPVVGRWTAKDPIRFDGGQANLYVYVGDDPVNKVDIFGRSSLGACLFDQAAAAYECALCAIERDGSSCFFCTYFVHASNENCPPLPPRPPAPTACGAEGAGPTGADDGAGATGGY